MIHTLFNKLGEVTTWQKCNDVEKRKRTDTFWNNVTKTDNLITSHPFSKGPLQ